MLKYISHKKLQNGSVYEYHDARIKDIESSDYNKMMVTDSHGIIQFVAKTTKLYLHQIKGEQDKIFEFVMTTGEKLKRFPEKYLSARVTGTTNGFVISCAPNIIRYVAYIDCELKVKDEKVNHIADTVIEL